MAKPAHPSRTRTQPLPPVTPPFKGRRQKAEQPLSDPTVNPVSGPRTHFQTNQASEVTHQAYLCRHSSPQALLPGPCHSQTNRTPPPAPNPNECLNSGRSAQPHRGPSQPLHAAQVPTVWREQIPLPGLSHSLLTPEVKSWEPPSPPSPCPDTKRVTVSVH